MQRSEAARDLFKHYLANRKDLADRLLADDFTFTSPRDDHIDKATYFDRCWPQPPAFRDIVIERLFESGDEVVVGYRAEKTDGGSFRNLELLRFRVEKIISVEVYFGRDG